MRAVCILLAGICGLLASIDFVEYQRLDQELATIFRKAPPWEFGKLEMEKIIQLKFKALSKESSLKIEFAMFIVFSVLIGITSSQLKPQLKAAACIACGKTHSLPGNLCLSCDANRMNGISPVQTETKENLPPGMKVWG